MLKTAFTDLVGCSVPVQGAPITSRAEFIAAVATAGALPMMGTGTEPPAAAVLVERVRAVRELTPEPFGVNFLVPFLDRSAIAAIASSVRVVEFFFGEPDPALVDLGHDGGALVCWQVGSPGEAMAAMEAGCDFIVVQGDESGGHVRGRMGLLPLLGEVVPRVEVPVVAAGTIGTGADMAAALTAGADAVRIGTLLVASNESLAHPLYKEALVAADAEDTVLTEAFDREWPEAPHRVLRTSLEAATRFDGEVVAENVIGDLRTPVHRFSTAPPSVYAEGAVEAMALYAGESVAGIREIQPVAHIVRQLCEEAGRLLDASDDA
ncbi:MAG TPA: nitronate monooxygenase [Acidimicrobiia bacterium]|nr:nitronate monooxygenase [Acidimicrobiia bacterium]